MADYPVYEKNGRTQIAPTPGAELRLKFSGWRKQEPPKTVPSGDPPDPEPAAAKPKRGTKPTTE